MFLRDFFSDSDKILSRDGIHIGWKAMEVRENVYFQQARSNPAWRIYARRVLSGQACFAVTALQWQPFKDEMNSSEGPTVYPQSA